MDNNSPRERWLLGRVIKTFKTMVRPMFRTPAAVISTRLHLMIMDELDLPTNSATFWTDSMTVLQYVTNEKRFKPFIANRVTEIHDASTPEQWRHAPTSLNPADEGSRGMDIHALKTKDQWPVKEIGKIPDDDKEVEVEKCDVHRAWISVRPPSKTLFIMA